MNVFKDWDMKEIAFCFFQQVYVFVDFHFNNFTALIN